MAALNSFARCHALILAHCRAPFNVIQDLAWLVYPGFVRGQRGLGENDFSSGCTQMKDVLLLGLVGFLAANVQGAQTGGNPISYKDLQQEVKKVEAKRVNALLKQDWLALEHIYADDYLSFDSRSGEVRNKSKVMEDLKNGNRKVLSVDDQDVAIRVYENAAVITGLSRSKVFTRGRGDSGPGRYIQVYVKRQGRWQLVAHQFTPLVE